MEDSSKMCTQFNKIAEILVESTAWADRDGKKQVGLTHVRKAIEEKIFRSDLLEEKILDGFKEGSIRIDTGGSQVGQINGHSSAAF